MKHAPRSPSGRPRATTTFGDLIAAVHDRAEHLAIASTARDRVTVGSLLARATYKARAHLRSALRTVLA